MKNLSFRNRTLNIGLIIALVLLGGSCKKEDCKPLYQQYGGASALVNDDYMEFGARYAKEANEKHTLLLHNIVWFANSTWALRNQISILELDLNLNDTMVLNYQLPGRINKLSAIFHTVISDGDAATECYEILETEDFPSWIVLTEHCEELGHIAGSLQAAFIISDECPQKNDPMDPDTIYLSDAHFRAAIIE